MSDTFFDRVCGDGMRHMPDVLSCLANLSNDEVFTPPEVVNKMLDLLPRELFRDPNVSFLDPACKTGVFLREIAKRLIDGLERQIPDLQKRIDHIFHNQLYGIAITELTALLSRRSLYCSKYPNGRYSISRFDNSEGNIRFRKLKHTWRERKCIYCGAGKEQYDRGDDLESYAYEFIHTLKPEEIFNMKFDVIISNPPYQLSDGGAQASAKPIYHLFFNMAKSLNPRYITMIIPARWMTGGKGLDRFRDTMIHDRRITVLHDFANAEDCFKGVDIKGGVCYFLWERGAAGKCRIYRHDTNSTIFSERFMAEGNEDIYIRYPILVEIKNKVKFDHSGSFENIVSARKPYGLPSDFFADPAKFGLPPVYKEPVKGGVSILGLKALTREKRYVDSNYPFPQSSGLYKYKLFITRAYGCGEIGEGPATPVLATPGEACTETFLEIGPFDTKKEARNVLSYIKTKFFRCLVGIRKQTQDATRRVYRFVPMQDFTDSSDIDWDKPVKEIDNQFYEKYSLSQDEIDFMESMIKPMDTE